MASRQLVDDRVSPTKTILYLAWPVLIEQLLATLVSSVDTAMVGSLGKVATASVSISMTPMMMIWTTFLLVGYKPVRHHLFQVHLPILFIHSMFTKSVKRTFLLMPS